MNAWTQALLVIVALTAVALRMWLSLAPRGEVALFDLVRDTDTFMHALFTGVHIAVPDHATLAGIGWGARRNSLQLVNCKTLKIIDLN